MMTKSKCPDCEYEGNDFLIFYGGAQYVCPKCSEVFDIPKKGDEL